MLYKILVTVIAFVLAYVISTIIIKKWILPFRKMPENERNQSAKSAMRNIGPWIGFVETVIIFSLVYAGEYGALAIIIGAKEYVRRKKIEEDASYYLLGTLINVAIAVLFAQVSLLIIADNANAITQMQNTTVFHKHMWIIKL